MATSENQTGVQKSSKKIRIKRIGLFLLAVLVIIQFIQPGKNNQDADMTNDISKVVTVPAEVHEVLKTSCYDCHSNYTAYPWYASIQPVGWWLKDHIDEGKESLNFQEFAIMKPRPGGRFKTVVALQNHRLEDIEEIVSDDEMPLTSYTIIHRDAKLDEAKKKLIIDWVNTAKAELMADASSKAGPSPEPAENEKD